MTVTTGSSSRKGTTNWFCRDAHRVIRSSDGWTAAVADGAFFGRNADRVAKNAVSELTNSISTETDILAAFAEANRQVRLLQQPDISVGDTPEAGSFSREIAAMVIAASTPENDLLVGLIGGCAAFIIEEHNMTCVIPHTLRAEDRVIGEFPVDPRNRLLMDAIDNIRIHSNPDSKYRIIVLASGGAWRSWSRHIYDQRQAYYERYDEIDDLIIDTYWFDPVGKTMRNGDRVDAVELAAVHLHTVISDALHNNESAQQIADRLMVAERDPTDDMTVVVIGEHLRG